MTTPRPAARPQSWVAYAGLVITVAGIVYQGGQLTSRVDQNAKDIARLQASDAARSEALEAINLRGARIEAKLDYLTPEKARR